MMKRLTILTLIAGSIGLFAPVARAQFYNSANGHYYQRFDVPAGLSWFAAKAAAEAQVFNGVNGYLATLTSSVENSFVLGNITVGNSWLGGFREPLGGDPLLNWKWVTNEPWNYTAWGTGEPNSPDAKDGLRFRSNAWLSTPRSNTVVSYIVEFPTPAGPELLHWADAAGGDFQDAQNWLQGIIPTAAGPATFNLNSTGYAVTSTADVATSRLTVKNDDVTLNLGNRQWILPGANTVTLRIGDTTGEDGSLTVSSGLLRAGRTLIGNPNSKGRLVVNGEISDVNVVDSAILVAGESSIEVSDSGNLNIEGTGETTLYVATHAGSTASVDVRGANSLLKADRIMVGERGTGQLDVSEGGQVVITEQSLMIGGTSAGPNPLAVGRVNVRNAGSQIVSESAIHVGSYNAEGFLTIEDGATVRSGVKTSLTGTSGIIADLTPQVRGTARVTGAGSRWMNDGALIVGVQGTGRLDVLQGGRVDSLRGEIARTSTAVGTVEISGTDSVWNVQQSLAIGGTEAAIGGTGALKISDGGRVAVAQALKLWNNGEVDVASGGAMQIGAPSTPATPGRLAVGAAGFLIGSGKIAGNVIVEGGQVVVGNRAGKLAIDGDYSQQQGVMHVEIGGLQPGASSDILDVSGQATLGGILNATAASSQSLPIGRSFQVLQAAEGVQGRFSQEWLPWLGSGKALATAYQPNAVRLAVIAPGRSQGDFDGNGRTDVADLAVLKETNGSGEYLAADANGDGIVAGDDFLIWQRNFSGTHANSVHRTIADARTAPLNSLVTVTGVVTSTVDMIAATVTKNFYLQDASSGINIFGDNAHINAMLQGVSPGDRIVVTGVAATFNGISQLVADASNRLVVVGREQTPAPIDVAVGALANNSATAEGLEGMLIKLSNVTFNSTGTFASGLNYLVSNSGVSAAVRIQGPTQDLIGQAIPTTPVNIVGILSQFDNTNPAPGVPGGGYQLLLRTMADITPVTPPGVATPEPSGALLGVLSLAFVGCRRRR